MEFPLESAIQIANVQADEFALPQTVYRNEETCGWANTNPFSGLLQGAEVFVTVLPKRFFN